ncbi:MAG: 4Fe-4S binding protein [Treponema sp.]|nr:4Fe-4S binding protein [Treponema sp.]
MKEIVVISGKGGTGKTSITASFTVLGSKNLVAADCDVDAADMHLLLKPDMAIQEDFYSGEVAVIDPSACIGCGRCAQVCHFGAIFRNGRTYEIDSLACEGCGYCSRVCPTRAISNHTEKAGELFVSTTRLGCTMVHAKLGIGSDNSGKLVAEVKKRAKALAEEQGKALVLVDGSPGVGCPVVSSLSGASFVVLATEPTVSGLHDLQRVWELVEKFKIPAGCIINKSDINPEMTEKIVAYLDSQRITLLAVLPYDESVTRAMIAEKTIVEYEQDSPIKDQIRNAWQRLGELLDKQTKEQP